MKHWIILVVMVCAMIEGSAYLVGKYLQNLLGRGIFYTPHVTETYQEYCAPVIHLKLTHIS
jgi:hypothetical protein